MYVYIRTEPSLWTAGFYTPDGKWEPESDHGSSEEAAERVAWLNGSRGQAPPAEDAAAKFEDAELDELDELAAEQAASERTVRGG